MKFNDLKINSAICELLKRQGIITPTAVQEKVIPQARSGKDLIIQSKTGTGKTLAFLLPTLERTKKIPVAQTLIIAPTRELATQISKVAAEVCKVLELDAILISGGKDIFAEKNKLRRSPQIIIGTPGRISDHLRRGTIQLSSVTTFLSIKISCGFFINSAASCLIRKGIVALHKINCLSFAVSRSKFSTSSMKPSFKSSSDSPTTILLTFLS